MLWHQTARPIATLPLEPFWNVDRQLYLPRSELDAARAIGPPRRPRRHDAIDATDSHTGEVDCDGCEKKLGRLRRAKSCWCLNAKVLKQLKFSNISTIQKMLAPNLGLEVFELNHPGGSMGYSLQSSRGKFTYLLDHEYLEEQLPFLLKFVEGSDFVLWDGMFTDHELANGRKGWGHSSIEQACSFAELAEIKKLAISHHSPARTDQELDMLSKTLTSDKVSFAIQNTEVTI